jgi:hypothetical protein
LSKIDDLAGEKNIFIVCQSFRFIIIAIARLSSGRIVAGISFVINIFVLGDGSCGS